MEDLDIGLWYDILYGDEESSIRRTFSKLTFYNVVEK